MFVIIIIIIIIIIAIILRRANAAIFRHQGPACMLGSDSAGEHYHDYHYYHYH